MRHSFLTLCLAAWSCLAACASAQEHPASVIDSKVDWPAFIARQDMVWDSMPKHFDTGAFLRNGMLGATI